MKTSKRDAQEVYRDEVRVVLERDFSCSLMNNTKWREVFDVLHALQVRTRIKRIFAPESGRWMLPSGSTHSWLPAPYVDESHPFRAVEIEWLEIEPFERAKIDGLEVQADCAVLLTAQLQAASVPYVWHEGIIRIVGHQRKS